MVSVNKVRDIHSSMKLLDGIHEEAANLLRDKQMSPSAIRALKKVTAVRQFEMAELIVSTNTFAKNYVDALLIGTTKHQLLNQKEAKKAPGMTTEKIARMEEEMEAQHGDFKAIESAYGDNMLKPDAGAQLCQETL